LLLAFGLHYKTSQDSTEDSKKRRNTIMAKAKTVKKGKKLGTVKPLTRPFGK
jgi:hypothetical protein